MSEAADTRRPLAEREFREVIGHFASGVTVITTRHESVAYGTTASAVSSLSSSPPMLLVCMNRSSATGQAVESAGRFAVNILGEEHPDVAMRFAGKGRDKFRDVAVADGLGGAPLLAEALATLECRVVEETAGGTHVVFLATVERASARSGAPLAYFRGQFGRLELEQDESAYRELRGMLLRGALTTDVPLDLAEIAETTGLVRSSVYHALSKLTGDGMVGRDPGGAFVITPLTADVMVDALRARETIEIGVATATVGRVEPERLADLRRAMQRTIPGAVDDWVAANTEFHEQMVALSGSTFLLDSYRRAATPAVISSLRTGAPAPGAEIEHLRLVEAYDHGDLEAAHAAIRRHAEHARRVSLANLPA